VLSELSPDRKAVAEQILRGGIPAVRQAVEEQNAKAREVGGPEIKADALLAVAEELVPALRAAEWRDKADAAVAIVDEIGLRDLRAIVSGADTARDEEGRALAATLREALDRRAAAERQTWVDEITTSLDDGRVVRALRISGRPPEPGLRFPAELAKRLSDAASEALGPDTTPDRWAAVLEAVVTSPVRRTIAPRGLPPEPGEALARALRLAAPRIPAIGALLGDAPGAPPRRPPRPGGPAGRPAATPRPTGAAGAVGPPRVPGRPPGRPPGAHGTPPPPPPPPRAAGGAPPLPPTAEPADQPSAGGAAAETAAAAVPPVVSSATGDLAAQMATPPTSSTEPPADQLEDGQEAATAQPEAAGAQLEAGDAAAEAARAALPRSDVAVPVPDPAAGPVTGADPAESAADTAAAAEILPPPDIAVPVPESAAGAVPAGSPDQPDAPAVERGTDGPDDGDDFRPAVATAEAD
jgi:hypothetical protein